MCPLPVIGDKPVIGLSGGVGAGKSTVAGMLASLGAGVIDSDALSRTALRDPKVVATLRRWWGPGVLRGEAIDRRAVADIVFAQPPELARLEGLLYPLISRRRDALIAAYTADDRVRAIVIDSPKLYESGLDAQCDVVIFVDTGARIRSRRLVADRGWDPEELRRREKLQKPLDIKRRKADYTVTNNSNIDALSLDVERIFSQVLTSFSS
ncbi:MAG: dephospho-CoA kinase [Phycisphaerae bacterium]